MEYRYNRKNEERGLGERKMIAQQSCKACDWAFQSVMGWGNNTAILASFREEKNPSGPGVVRIPGKIFDLGKLFDGNTKNRTLDFAQKEKRADSLCDLTPIMRHLALRPKL
jgi:hypothetical protein